MVCRPPSFYPFWSTRSADGKMLLLSKGDNNTADDRGLYAERDMWLYPEDIMGRVKGFLPHVGMVTILLTDYPYLKYALVGIMGLFVITSKE